ncbi:Rv3235 family protein [Streptomyces tremellae]|uniref:Uncharacterized protein n=1 Tax=Streptomyces tremellae TaxID=1124239 RepID=A0ABP7G4B1_9ACTN
MTTTKTVPMPVPGRTPAARASDASAARVISARRPPSRRDPRGPGAGPAGRRAPLRPPHSLFAERLLAVLSGERPVHWMLGWTVGEAYEQLVRLAPAVPLRPRPGQPTPVVRRCRAFRPGPDAVEAFATLASGDRVRAMAFRLERAPDHRWRCAAVEIDGPRPPRADS